MRFCVEHKTKIAEVKVEIIKHHTEGRKLLEANLFFIGTAERKINKKNYGMFRAIIPADLTIIILQYVRVSSLMPDIINVSSMNKVHEIVKKQDVYRKNV